MDRETTTLEIGDHKFVAKTYATARETNTIQSALFKETKVEVQGQTPKITDFSPSAEFEMKLEMARQLIVTMDGSNENIAERCENLPNEVFQELSVELDALISKKKQ